MKLIVGLGNPGKDYENTRHNVGFMVIDNYANNHSLIFKKKFNGLYSEFNINNEKIILLKPQSYMNLSGQVVKEFKNYFDIDVKDILVIYDDASFELGVFKLKKDGSSGGHNGIKDILENFKTEEIKRLKIGISKKQVNIKNHVLGKFGILEKSVIKKVIVKSEYIIEDFCRLEFDKLMCKYNGASNEDNAIWEIIWF